MKDELLEGGRHGRMTNGINYREVRQYRTDFHLVRYNQGGGKNRILLLCHVIKVHEMACSAVICVSSLSASYFDSSLLAQICMVFK